MSQLNSLHKSALNVAVDGHNFILLGSAGTGKSFVVSRIVETLKSMGKNVALTCSTGIACRVYDTKYKATTVHRFAGIEDGRYDPKEIAAVISCSPRRQEVLKRVKTTDTVIIDECSMISARTFHSVAEVLALKDPSKMFGGIQVILSGDFRQLPPVKDAMFGDDGAFCFEVSFFDLVLPHHIELNEIVRQSDKTLAEAIRKILCGTLSEDTITFIKSRNVEIPSEEDVVHLFATNDKVDDFNRRKSLDFPAPLHEFNATDEGEDTCMLKRLTVPKNLWLKIGIPVILLRNITDQLVNGLRGEVYDIDSDGPTVEFLEIGITFELERFPFEVFDPRLGKTVATKVQYPLKPAFGITVHIAQGMTLERVHVDCQDIFQPGQLGVAVSRVKSAKGLFISNFHQRYCIAPSIKVSQVMDRESEQMLDDKSCCRACRRNETPVTSELSDVQRLCISSDVNLESEDEDQFDLDFDQNLQAMDTDSDEVLNFPLPDNFCLGSVIDIIKIPKPVTPSQHHINDIVSQVPPVKLEMFCKKEFLAVSSIIKKTEHL